MRATLDVSALCRAVAKAYGTGDGLYAKAPTSDTVGHVSEDDQGDYPYQFSPALPWRYTTSGFHATSGGYVDQLKFSVGVTSGGNAPCEPPRHRADTVTRATLRR